MANTDNNILTNSQPTFIQSTKLGVPVTIPVNRSDDAAMIIRLVIALSDETSNSNDFSSIEDRVGYMALIMENLNEIASFAKEVVNHG